MNGIKWLFALVLLAAAGALAWWWQQALNHEGFEAVQTFPMDRIDRFFDVGVVDANDDGNLDIYTSNHHFRQVLLLSDGKGGYRDVLSEWGLDQSPAFPNAELSFTPPEPDRPGLYIYWRGTQFLIQAHETGNIGPISGTLQVNDPVKVMKNDGFQVDKEAEGIANGITRTTLRFSTDGDAYLRLRPAGQGLPIRFRIEGALKPEQIFVGLGKASPDTTSFTLASRDRHALAWADYSQDGHKDLFINRGALSGTLRAQPDDIRRLIQDELLVRQPDGRFKDIARDVGIEKRDCSGRHARWLDFDNDGLLDLFVNCFDRKHTRGEFPKQLYIQQPDGRFRDLARQSGLAIPEQQIGSYAWFDVENDGDIDLVTLQNEGFFLYRNDHGKVTEETLYRRPLTGVQIGSSTEGAWVYDGKISAGDFDRDGDIDLFSASKRGNVLLINQDGRLEHRDPSSVGLPATSLNASWVDYDNDGRPDLHAVPQGLYHQGVDGRFKATGVLAFPDQQYQGAVSNWFDMDNDGRMDLMMALNANPEYDPWWRSVRIPRLRTTWLVQAWRNSNAGNHWLQLKLVGNQGNHEALGARVTVFTPDGSQTQEVGATDGAFFSQGHYRLYFGLGNNPQANRIEIRWPDGGRQILNDVPGDRLLTISHAME